MLGARRGDQAAGGHPGAEHGAGAGDSRPRPAGGRPVRRERRRAVQHDSVRQPGAPARDARGRRRAARARAKFAAQPEGEPAHHLSGRAGRVLAQRGEPAVPRRGAGVSARLPRRLRGGARRRGRLRRRARRKLGCGQRFRGVRPHHAAPHVHRRRGGHPGAALPVPRAGHGAGAPGRLEAGGARAVQRVPRGKRHRPGGVLEYRRRRKARRGAPGGRARRGLLGGGRRVLRAGGGRRRHPEHRQQLHALRRHRARGRAARRCGQDQPVLFAAAHDGLLVPHARALCAERAEPDEDRVAPDSRTEF